LGGIRPNPKNPGFKKFILGPSAPEGLIFVNCSYNTPFGEIISNWKKIDKEIIRYEMKIPTGTEANVILSLNRSQNISITNTINSADSNNIKNLHTGNFNLKEGEYIITIVPKKD
jgi:alpha-L-rhamnosidase